MYFDEPLKDVAIDFVSNTNRFDLQQLDFSYLDARLTSSGALAFSGDNATLNASGELSSLMLHEFVDTASIRQDERLHDSLTGKFTLESEGSTLEELVSAASGEVKLKAAPPSNRIIDIDLTQIENGLEARINQLNWADSDLKGEIIYRRGTPAQLEIKVDGGILDLRPWEKDYLERFEAANEEGSEEDEDKGKVARTAQGTGRFAPGCSQLPGTHGARW